MNVWIFLRMDQSVLEMMINSVSQTDSALSNLSLNIHGHVEVPKSNKTMKKIMSVGCNQPLYIVI